MLMCFYGDTNIYQEEIKKILEGESDMATTKYGFTKMTANEFKTWIKQQGNYKYTGIQIHHTWKPDYSNFYKADGSHEDELVRQNNTKNYHVKTNGWADIAQHFTIYPNGVVVTGRKLSNTTPVGIKGWNANKICIEIYGNFDKGHDIMTAEQKTAVITVYGELCKKFNITPSIDTIRCHAWFTSGGTYLGDYNPSKSAKTCPGTNFMGFGNTKAAIRDNFIPMIKNYISGGGSTPVINPIDKSLGIYKVTDDELNVREQPNASSRIVGVLKKGEAYTITKTSGNWGLLKSGLGWINLNYCEKISSAGSVGVYKITADTLNIRKGPGTSYAVVGTVKKGDAYTITKVQDDWGYLKSGAGWIHLGYAKKIK